MQIAGHTAYSLGAEGVLDAASGEYAFFSSFYYEQHHIAIEVSAIAVAVLNNEPYELPIEGPLKSNRYRAKSWRGRDENQVPCIFVGVCDDRHGNKAERAIMLSTAVYDTAPASLLKFDEVERIAEALNALRFSWRPRSFRHN